MSQRPGTRTESVDGGAIRTQQEIHPVPGLVLVFSAGQPQCVVLPLQGGQLELGRADGASLLPADSKMSRHHATVFFDGQRFRVVDHDSHNGTFLDGVRVQKSASSATARLLRTGESVFLLSSDVRALRARGVTIKDAVVLGPSLQIVMEQAGRAAQFGRTLHITGETGSGKEGVARIFHAQSPLSRGPFVALNCATIAAGVAERMLFGARRGAFSGAVADSEGLVQAADGGTLFLDEVGEIDLAVQAKLLRVLETSEVLPLGALRSRRVDFQLCSASHKDLRAEVSSGRFREDLYFRINSPEVIVPPLRQRLEEIPGLLGLGLRSVRPELGAHSTFVEACLLRYWPGNVRELLAEARAAAQDALGLGAARVEAQHLRARAGQPIQKSAEPAAGCALVWHPPVQKPSGGPEPSRIEEVLRQSGGNISAAARALGLHRTQLTRMMELHGISASRGDSSLDQDTKE